MRTAALILALSLAACAAPPTHGGGYANYDALKAAQDACAAKGGELTFKSGDTRLIQNYACKRD